MENKRLPEDVIDCILKVRQDVQETEEEFVYKTILPYSETIIEHKLEKEKLKRILTNGMQAESKANEIIAEIESQEKWLESAGYNAYNVDIAFKSILSRIRKEFLDNGSNRNQ